MIRKSERKVGQFYVAEALWGSRFQMVIWLDVMT